MTKEDVKKEIEKIKTKVYFELENYTDEVLVFGNDRVASSFGELDKIISKIASIIIQLSMQSGIKEKELLKVLKYTIKVYKHTYGGNNG